MIFFFAHLSRATVSIFALRLSIMTFRYENPFRLGRVIASAFLLCLIFATPAIAAASGCGAASKERATVLGAGDRLEITLADGRKVRLAGLDIPDPGRGDPATAAAARRLTADWLAGREVGLTVLSARTDRWGRTLADLSAPPPDGATGAGPVSVSLFLVGAGLARVWPEPETKACLSERLRAESAARDNRLGLWRDPYYAVVNAADLDNLRNRDGQFTLVEGTPSRVGEGRSRFFVDFALHRGFTIVVAKRRAKAFEQVGMAISALSGVKIRVRGALDNRFGLRMEISEPENIERLE